MFRFVMKETDEYDRLVEFMEPFGLEFHGEKDLETEILKCWKVVQDPDYLVGGVILSLRKGEYYISGIAVDPVMRRMGIGKVLMNKAIKEVQKRGGKRIYLCAKVPEFFAALGFQKIPWDEASDLFGCSTCDQRGVSCFPEAMKLEV